jgi:hypothetical protein
MARSPSNTPQKKSSSKATGNSTKSKESTLENEILTTLNSSNLGFFWKNPSSGFFDGTRWRKHASPFAINGTPDILGILKGGRFAAIEVKTKTGVVSDAQEKFIAKAQRLGACVGVARSAEEALRIMQDAHEPSLESDHAQSILK